MERSVELVAHSHGPDDTGEIAAAIAQVVVANDVIVLGGDLGAGKTAFTKAFGAALGVTESITSPTFTLAQQYETGRLTVHHLDVYRLEQLDEVIDLALPELFESGGVVVIEWGDTILPALPSSYLIARFEFGAGADDRRIELQAVGSAWATRMPQLADGLGERIGA